MEHRPIGELSASVVGMGCNQLGTVCDQDLTVQIIGEALDAGVNYFDTADEYGRQYFDPTVQGGWGLSEEYLGHALKGHRDEVIIVSKFGILRRATAREAGAAPAGSKWQSKEACAASAPTTSICTSSTCRIRQCRSWRHSRP